MWLEIQDLHKALFLVYPCLFSGGRGSPFRSVPHSSTIKIGKSLMGFKALTGTRCATTEVQREPQQVIAFADFWGAFEPWRMRAGGRKTRSRIAHHTPWTCVFSCSGGQVMEWSFWLATSGSEHRTTTPRPSMERWALPFEITTLGEEETQLVTRDPSGSDCRSSMSRNKRPL